VTQNNQVAFDNFTSLVEAAGGANDTQMASMFNLFAKNANYTGSATAIVGENPELVAQSALNSGSSFIAQIPTGEGGSHAVTYVPNAATGNLQVYSSAFNFSTDAPEVYTYQSPADEVSTGINQAGGATGPNGIKYYSAVIVK
jgi:hypothetical protein